MHRTGFFLSLLALALTIGLGACRREPGADRLVVGMNMAYPPFEMMNIYGEPAGVSVDMAHALGRYLDREVVIYNMPFSGLIPALRTGRIDVIISSMTITPARAKVVAFSEPYLHTGLALLVGDDSPVKGIGDLEQPGHRVAVMLGFTGQVYAEEYLPPANILVVEREDSAVLELIQDRVDAVIIDQMAAFRIWERHPRHTRPLLKPFQTEAWAIALRKDDPELRAEINAFIGHYRQTGGFERLGDKFLGRMKKAFREQGIPFVF